MRMHTSVVVSCEVGLFYRLDRLMEIKQLVDICVCYGDYNIFLKLPLLPISPLEEP